MRAKSLLLLMLALGCGLVASIGITQVMAKRNQEPVVATGEMDAIFVAMEDIPMGDPVTAQMVKLEEWPKDKIPPGALTKIEDLEHRRPKTKIYKGSPVLDNQLLNKGESERGATTHIPKGYRVVPVKVDNVSGGSSMILPGDRVDVLVHLRRGQDLDITSTRTILQDVKVFAVNDVFDLDSADGNSKLLAQTISLLVTPDDAEKVIMASEMGKIRLVMRSPEDDEQVATRGAEPHELLGLAKSSDRGGTSSSPRLEPQNDLADTADFVDWLNSQKAGASAEAPMAPPPAPDNWRMRIISAGEVSDVMLESECESSVPETSASGRFSLWKMISSVRWGDGTAGATAADAGQAPAEEEQLEPEEDEPKPEKEEDEEEDPLDDD